MQGIDRHSLACCSAAARPCGSRRKPVHGGCRGDLVVDLVAPDGSSYRLKNSSGSDSADNVVATYTVNLSTEALNGAWKLKVQDVYSGDTGYINSWNVTF